MIHHISAVTFAVRSMPEAITFYGKLGFTLVYGGPQARFSTLQAGTAFVNLTLSPDYLPAWWGRTIFRVDDVDAVYQTMLAAGYTPTPPQNGVWGERYFHLTDPNGHELSFAQLLTYAAGAILVLFPVMRSGCQTRDGYWTGVARGWPFSPTKKTSTLAGAVVLAFFASCTILAGLWNASPALKVCGACPCGSNVSEPSRI
jgi:catechol 2,3-dioxygenase-like lactoylglutathione lyase family enzyme